MLFRAVRASSRVVPLAVCLLALGFTACKSKADKEAEAAEAKRVAARDAFCVKYTSSTASGSAKVCTNAHQAQNVGELNTSILREASGLAVSRLMGDRYYHINDSGDAAAFYITDSLGRNTQTVSITTSSDWPSAVDVEAVSVGPCHLSSTGSCIFIADIGDNTRARTTIKIVVLPELLTFGASVSPLQVITLKYPSGRHDAEAFAAHPQSGNLYLITKSLNNVNKTYDPSVLYGLARDTWDVVPAPTATLTLTSIATIDFPSLYLGVLCGDPAFDPSNFEKIVIGGLKFDDLASSSNPVGKLMVTDMAIAPGGSEFAVLTYGRLYRFGYDLDDLLEKKTDPENEEPMQFGAADEMQYGVDYLTIDPPLMILPRQAEAMSYGEGKSTLIYSSEGEAPLYRADCD